MAGPEATVEQWVCDEAWTRHGVPNLKLGQHGWPDRLFLIPGGRPLLIEFKAPGEEPRPRQAERHRTLRKLGYDVEVHDDKAQALEAVLTALRRALG